MKEFTYPRSRKPLLLFVVLFFTSFALLGIYLAAFESASIPSLMINLLITLCFIVLATLAFRSYRKGEEVVMVDDSGIFVATDNASKPFVKWSDIYAVGENALFQRIELKNSLDDAVVKIGYHLHGINDFCNIFATRMNLAEYLRQNNRDFAVSWFIRVAHFLGFITFSALTVSFIIFFNVFYMLVFAALDLFLLYEWVTEVKSVKVENHAVVIGKLYKKLIIQFENIHDVYLRVDVVGRNNSKLTAYVIHGKEKPLKIRGMQGGSFPVYVSIKTALDRFINQTAG